MSRRARDHARRLVAAISEDDRNYLAEDPIEGLGILGFTVRFRPERDIAAGCSVAGSYHPGPPPTITIVDSRSAGRRHFTGLHELGHRLVAGDPALHDEFDDEPDQGKGLEELVCDAVAGVLLLPDHVVDAHITAAGPTARGVLALFEQTQASREACCVRAAQRITGSGHVMLVHEGVARYTASANTVYTVARGTPQPEGGPALLALERGSARGRAPVRYASGGLSDQFHVDAVADGKGFAFAVFVDVKPAWNSGLSLVDRDDVVTTNEAYCPHCEMDFEALGAPCPKCGGFVHRGNEGCGKCACPPGAVPGTRLCHGCFLQRPPAEFPPGADRCNVCLDG